MVTIAKKMAVFGGGIEETSGVASSCVLQGTKEMGKTHLTRLPNNCEKPVERAQRQVAFIRHGVQ